MRASAAEGHSVCLIRRLGLTRAAGQLDFRQVAECVLASSPRLLRQSEHRSPLRASARVWRARQDLMGAKKDETQAVAGPGARRRRLRSKRPAAVLS
eukprot:4563813-Alexandrium_andersonii.AAC.1